MAKKNKQNNKKSGDASIAQNRRARFDYHIEENFEAGLSLMGWEVKALRAGNVQLNDTYVIIRDGEAFLIGCHIHCPAFSLHSCGHHSDAPA